MSLYSSFESIDLYYRNMNYEYKKLLSNPSDKSSDTFIRKYFEYGSKIEVFNSTFLSKYNKDGKYLHTVSLYLIGSHLHGIIDSALCEKVRNKIKGSDIWYMFQYSWFLTALYHDSAFVIEDIKEKTKDKNSSENKNLKDYLKTYKVKRNPFTFNPLEHINNQNNIKSKNSEYFIYSEHEVIEYFNKSLEEKKVDHGIIAGYIMFDRLIENYDKAYDKAKKVSKSICKNNFEYMGLCWRIEHQFHFMMVSNAIIAHNIWFELLSKATAKKTQKISMQKWPLLFYLGLLDTIEPIKMFEEHFKPKEVWKYIDMSICDAENSCCKYGIKINIDQKIKSKKDIYDKWISKIYGILEWLDVSIEPEEKEHVTNEITIVPINPEG